MQNKCFNCLYFLNCNKSDPLIINCKDFKETKVKEISNDNNTQRPRLVNKKNIP